MRGRRYGQIRLVTNPFDIGKAPHQVPVGRGKLFLISGPCVIESEHHARTMADAIWYIAVCAERRGLLAMRVV